MRDAELVAAACTGDTEAFAGLTTRHRARAEALVARVVGEEAEDVVQEALLRAYLALPQLREPSRFGAWLCGIALNVAKMRVRRRALEAGLALEQPLDETVEERAMLAIVRDAVEVLPLRMREVVLLHYVEDLSCEEVAAILGTSPGAVRVRLHRAREQLREELAVFAPRRPPKEEVPMIEMKLEDVVVRVAEDDPLELVAPQRILVLAEVDGERRLPIWVGAPEGDALALRLTRETTPRPMTSDLLVAILRATGARVEKVAVTALREKTYYAAITLAIDGRSEEVDARPSDALNLAVRVGAPIFVAEDILAENALPPGDLEARMEAETGVGGIDLPAGQWRSLSAEMLRTLYRVP